jgi:hypothetical protein
MAIFCSTIALTAVKKAEILVFQLRALQQQKKKQLPRYVT